MWLGIRGKYQGDGEESPENLVLPASHILPLQRQEECHQMDVVDANQEDSNSGGINIAAPSHHEQISSIQPTPDPSTSSQIHASNHSTNFDSVSSSPMKVQQCQLSSSSKAILPPARPAADLDPSTGPQIHLIQENQDELPSPLPDRQDQGIIGPPWLGSPHWRVHIRFGRKYQPVTPRTPPLTGVDSGQDEKKVVKQNVKESEETQNILWGPDPQTFDDWLARYLQIFSNPPASQWDKWNNLVIQWEAFERRNPWDRVCIHHCDVQRRPLTETNQS